MHCDTGVQSSSARHGDQRRLADGELGAQRIGQRAIGIDQDRRARRCRRLVVGAGRQRAQHGDAAAVGIAHESQSLGIDEALLAEPGERCVDVVRARFGGGLGRPVAAADVLEPAGGETVDHQRDIAPALQKLGHARVVDADAAAAMKDRHRRQRLRRCRTIELGGELDGAAGLLDGHAHRLLGQNRAGAEKAKENAQETTHGRQPRTFP